MQKAVSVSSITVIITNSKQKLFPIIKAEAYAASAFYLVAAGTPKIFYQLSQCPYTYDGFYEQGG